MRTFFIYLIISISLSTGIANCQTPEKNTPQVLEDLFDRLVGNFNDTARIRINDSIRTVIDEYVRSDSVFSFRFTNLKYLGQIMSPDSTLKIVTWNLVLENEPGRYFCYFIRKPGTGQENEVYKLMATYNGNPVKTDTTYSISDWYGALYYDLKPFVLDNNSYWVLLGIDYGNPDISRKIIETLSFKPDGSLVFGRKWFVSDNNKNYRSVFEYASNAMMSLRFRTANSIVFDHLVPFSESQKDNRQFYGPDYSFDAYNFENNEWKLVINVDARNKE
jgi:hypothetical protein